MNHKKCLKTFAFGLIFLSFGCNSSPLTNTSTSEIKIEGSSTVYPITESILEEFRRSPVNVSKNINLSLTVNGTGEGFKRLCNKEIYINNASRAITTQELDLCRKSGVSFFELPIAFDAIAVVVNKDNNWLTEMTVTELKQLWEPEAENKIVNWNQIRSQYPAQPIKLYAPGDGSGTSDFFTETVIGEIGKKRQDYVNQGEQYSQDYVSKLITNIEQEPNALGYLSFAYYQAARSRLKAVAINGGSSPVLPSVETIEKQEYKTLTRPLFIYVNSAKFSSNPNLQEFVNFYIVKSAKVALDLGYVNIPIEASQENITTLKDNRTGTVFEGKAHSDLPLTELLKQPRN